MPPSAGQDTVGGQRREVLEVTVREWMTTDPMVIGPDAQVRDARQLLRDRGIRHLPVVDAGEVIGIVSDRDVRIDDRSLRRLEVLERVGELMGEGKPVEAVMSSPVHTIGPGASVGDAARLLLSQRISALPVINEDRALVGIITITDCLLAAMAKDRDIEPMLPAPSAR